MSSIKYTGKVNPKARTAGEISPDGVISLIKWYVDTNGIIASGGVGGSETDPVFTSSAAYGITNADIALWDSALQADDEVDPVFTASAAFGIDAGDISSWNSAASLASTALQPEEFGLPLETGILIKTGDGVYDLRSLTYYEQADSNIVKKNAATTITGLFTFNTSSGSVPFAVNSGDNGIVTNLNADRLDSYHGSSYPRKAENAAITGAWDFPSGGISIGALELAQSNLQSFYDTASTVSTKEASWDAAAAYQTVGLADDDFDNPLTTSVGILKRTTAAGVGNKGSYAIIADNSSNWDSAYAAAVTNATDAATAGTLVKRNASTGVIYVSNVYFG